MKNKQSDEVELRVVGGLIGIGTHKNQLTQKVMLQINEHCFGNSGIRQLFSLVNEQFKREKPFDETYLVSFLATPGPATESATRIIEGGYHYKSTLESDTDELITLFELRKQLSILRQGLKLAEDEQNPELSKENLTQALTEVHKVESGSHSEGQTYADIVDAYFDGLHDQEDCVPTGIESFDRPLGGGFRTGSLVTCGAGEGVGKTNIAIFLMHHLTKQRDKQSLYFNLEMKNSDIIKRHAGLIIGKPFNEMTEYERQHAFAQVHQFPITVYDEGYDSIDTIETVSRIQAMTKSVGVIVVDYLTLIQNKTKFERNDLKQADITQRLASLALELDCIVIALSQTNRNKNHRAKDDRCPYPFDAADSSGSQRSSTLWFGIDRPELYDDNPVYQDKMIVMCRKNRHGSNFGLTLNCKNGILSEIRPGYMPHIETTQKTPMQYLSLNTRN